MTTIIRHNPDVVNVFDNIEKVFDGMLGRIDLGLSTVPAVDVIDKGKKYVLEAELPGYTENDVEVRLEAERLIIKSKQEGERQEEEGTYLIRERSRGSFERSFALPKDVDRDRITASFGHGILTLDLPRLPNQEPRRITIGTK
jgi:HSP20 family protein